MSCNREWTGDRGDSALKEWILRKLGCDVIDVELTDPQLDDAILEAKEHWLEWVGMARSVELDVQSGNQEYPADLLGPDVNSVIDVYFDAYDDSLRDVFGWADVEINPFQWTWEGRGGYSAIVQYNQYREIARGITSSDKDWEWDKSRRMLVISPRYNQSRKIMVVYLSRCFDYDYLEMYEWSLFRQYALAKGMQNLAFIRSKFPEKPGAGGSFSMDGETMYANGEALELRIEEKMKNMEHPTGIMTG